MFAKIQSALAVIMLCSVASIAFGQNIVINEIVTSNTSVNADEDGSHEDWIEFFNTSSESVSLNGYGLTDNPAVPFKWIFPDYLIGPGDHLLVWCSDKNRTNPALPLHTNFKISSAGETLRLTRPDGNTEDEFLPVIIAQNTSYGRLPSGGSEFETFLIPTPNAQNSVGSQSLTEPVFSVGSGFFDSSFLLSITHPDPEVTIVYTLDGSEPNTENLGGRTYQYKNQYQELPTDTSGELLSGNYATLPYTLPLNVEDRNLTPNKIAMISSTFNYFPYYLPALPVSKSTVVRARAYKAGAHPSKTVTRNYFIGIENTSLPIVSLNTDENLLFDYENGIYVAGKGFEDWRSANPTQDAFYSTANYTRSGDASEIKANFSLYKNGQEQIMQDIGLRTHGGFSRHFSSKSLRLYGRSEYGEEWLNYRFFEDREFDNYKTLILRNAGNDFPLTYFRDAFIQKSVAHFHVDTQAYQPVVTYLNGEYWGLLNMRERYDKHYFKRTYDISEEQLDFLESNGSIVQEGDYVDYGQILAYLENHNLSDDANYAYIVTRIDPENFTDFFIANIYARNTDWPHNNIEFWRKRTSTYEPQAPLGQDGRWRWVLKDTDFGFGYSGGPESYTHNTLAFASATGGAPESTNPEWSTFLFRKLLESETFKINFINRFADMINTTYLPARLNGIISEMKSGIESEIEKHGQRWQTITSLAQWNDNINVMREFADQRPDFQRDHLREKFGITENIAVSLDVDDNAAGFIKINTIEINGNTPGVAAAPYPWTGIYFKDIPVTLTAIAQEGYQFSYWSGDVESVDPQITITPNANFSVTAHFIAVEPISNRIPIYFWALDSNLPNLSLLTNVNATYGSSGAALNYTSCLSGYPFPIGHADWGKAAMTKGIHPTHINYIAEANYGIEYAAAELTGIVVTGPFHSGNQENVMQFDFPTDGYENIVVSFAAKTMNAADALRLDYSTSSGQANWVTTGLPLTLLPLDLQYTLYTADLTAIDAINDNPDFKLRLRFAGENMEAINGGFVSFNNVSLSGSPKVLGVAKNRKSTFEVYPNPFTETVFVKHPFPQAAYSVHTVDGKILAHGKLVTEVDLSNLPQGIYILRLSSDGVVENTKLIKK